MTVKLAAIGSKFRGFGRLIRPILKLSSVLANFQRQGENFVKATSTQVAQDRSQFLRSALQVNAVFSTISGLLAAVFPGQVAGFLGIKTTSILGLFSGQTLIFIIALSVLIFAAGLWIITARRELDRRAARVVFALDVTWVLVSVAILVAGLLPLTTEGLWAILVITDIVAVIAALEYYGLRRSR